MILTAFANGHRLDVHTSSGWWGDSRILYDGEEVSRRSALSGEHHEFTVTEDGNAVQYEVAIGTVLTSLDSFVSVHVHRNRELVVFVG